MLDRTWIRENLDQALERLQTKNFQLDRDAFVRLDQEERQVRVEWENKRALRNRTSDQIAELKKHKEDATEKIEEMKLVSTSIKQLDEQIKQLDQRMEDFLAVIPNLPHPSVPVGPDEGSNQVVRTVGEPPRFDFEIQDHVTLGVNLGILDPDRASKIAGARFVNLYGAGAMLERALINFMLDLHAREHGYLEILPPFMANRTSFFGTGNLPKFESDLFRVEGTDYYLVPTAEVPVTNVFAGEILPEEKLPISFVAYTPCFRSEAGSYGKDTRGLIRQHQFDKVELVKFTTPEDSHPQLDQLTSHAEEVLRRLKLPYRAVLLASGDTGFSSTKTYDLEVWVPSQNCYREISSCSNFEDFQARRAGIRFRPEGGGKARLVHTLNGSGLAVGRTWLAILENFQRKDGTICIPEALRPWMNGMEELTGQPFMLA